MTVYVDICKKNTLVGAVSDRLGTSSLLEEDRETQRWSALALGPLCRVLHLPSSSADTLSKSLSS